MEIHGPRNPVLRIATYEDKKWFQESGNLYIYNTICYEWAYIHYDKSEYGWGPDSPYVRHIHG